MQTSIRKELYTASDQKYTKTTDKCVASVDSANN